MLDAAAGLTFLAEMVELTGAEKEDRLPVDREFVRGVCATAADVLSRAQALVEKLIENRTGDGDDEAPEKGPE
jgi:hypothetical protein